MLYELYFIRKQDDSRQAVIYLMKLFLCNAKFDFEMIKLLRVRVACFMMAH